MDAAVGVRNGQKIGAQAKQARELVRAACVHAQKFVSCFYYFGFQFSAVLLNFIHFTRLRVGEGKEKALCVRLHEET